MAFLKIVFLFVEPFLKRISDATVRKFDAEPKRLKEIERRLDNFKKDSDFYRCKNELEKISDMLKQYFTDHDKVMLSGIKDKIDHLTSEYESDSLEMQTAYSNPAIFQQYFNFPRDLLNRQKNTRKNRLKRFFDTDKK